VRILYRIHQFWRSLSAKPAPQELEQALAILTPEQRALFTQLQPGEQVHAVGMVQNLVEQGETQPELLVAALMHDVGKLRYRLRPVERAIIVLVKAVRPVQAQRWGSLPSGGWDGLPGWRKAFILAEQHPAWGAEMARQVGVSSLTEMLIRKHHQPPRAGSERPEDSLQQKLWAVDNEN
jgi:hypothetical protein